jgi:hypothetical protein
VREIVKLREIEEIEPRLVVFYPEPRCLCYGLLIEPEGSGASGEQVVSRI